MKPLFFFLATILPVLGQNDPRPGDTHIAKWKDNKAGSYMLMFDDSWPSHWQVAIPALQERGLVATFYINPGKGEYRQYAKKWEGALARSGMVYGDHTMTHQGVKNLEDAQYEIGECARVIRKIQPGKPDRLVSYGQPGVGEGQWNISSEELRALLKEHRLISRPSFKDHGAVYHKKTLQEMTDMVDKAIALEDKEYLVVHGVERFEWDYQDMWPLAQNIFLPLLDYLKEKSDAGQLWVTDHITLHQYEAERNQAEVDIRESGVDRIRLVLKTGADPLFYDQPLTLLTQVPDTWQKVKIVQNGRVQTRPVTGGVVTYDAQPDGSEIVLSPDL